MNENTFHAMPPEFENELHASINKIQNECLRNTYLEIQFKYLLPSKFQDENTFISFLYDYLKYFNFIAYEVSNLNSETNSSNLIISVEDNCFIIDTINNKIIDEILKKFDYKVNANDFERNEDIENFCSQFYKIATSNEFINTIFRVISCYLIRRYFYPTHFFKKPSFFQYKNEKINFFENNIKQKMTKILKSNNKEEINNLYLELLNDITQNKKEEEENYPIYEFDENDFVIIKSIPKNKSTFYLVVDTETLHPFMMSDCSNREIEFCKKYNHSCFTRFYGFVKDKNKDVTKMIYEYMTNGDLSEFISKSENIIDESYIFLTIYRIFQGIEFLRSNSLVHRDLKPSNILIDHDFIPYIADFEFIRPIKDGNFSTHINGSIFYASPEIQNWSNISYSSDIYSFGLIIYFLFEKKDMIHDKDYLVELFNTKFKNIKKMENGSENLKKIYYSSVVYDRDERITNDEINEILLNEFESFYYLDKYFIKQSKQKLYSIISQFIYERIKILDSNQLKKYMNHIYEFMHLKFELNNQINNESALINIGDIYYYKNNYIKALEYYELASQLNNSDGYLYLADLYYGGKGIPRNYGKAFELYKKSAELNNPKSLYNLGNMYLNGIGVTQDIKKAFEYYVLSAKLNNPNALHDLGIMYIEGQCEKNYVKAKECFDKLAEQNDPKAFLLLGYCYEFGIGVSPNPAKVKEYYQLAANQNNPIASNELGSIYFKEKNYKLAKYYYELSAKNGCLIAYNNLGHMYMNCEGIEQDYTEAFKCLKIASQLMIPSANVNLGVLYYYGLGVEKYYKEAIKYFEQASYFNHQDALVNLGIMYFNGIGVDQNYSKSLYYYDRAAKQNNPKALFNIGNMYYFGNGVQQDYIKARNMYELAAQQNDPQALFNLGHLYLFELGVKKDYIKAFNYFNLSARLGNLTALLNIGNLYFYGIGVEKNYSKALEIYEKVSTLNDPHALFNLGICHYYGRIVPLDYNKAVNYFIKSSQSNHSWAQLYLGICYYKGNGVEQNYEKSKEYFILSADQNNHWALYYLGKCFLNGFGFLKDYHLAMKYFTLAANKNNSYAQFQLGNMYMLGFCGEKDISKALEYFQMSSMQCNISACLYLAYFYLYGYGVEQNFPAAKKLLIMLSKLNDSNALLLLGIYYSMAEKNYTEAIKYYKLSTNLNNSYALFNLGSIYYFEQGVKKDYNAALFYYEKSAKLNNSFALLQIGNIYFNGDGVKQDYEKSKYYYEKAAKLKNSNAFLNLGLMYYLGLGIEKDHLKAKSLFEQATLFNNPSAYYYLGLYYLNEEKNYSSAIHCFEISAKRNDPVSIYFLGYIYSNDSMFEYDVDKAIQYFLQCLEIKNEITLDFYDTINFSLISAFKYNNYCYRSSNDLGLIYLIDKNDMDKAINYIKKAAFGEFPYAQNNYGLLCEYYFKNIDDAIYFYGKSSKNNFTLAFVNLAKLKEKSGKINEAIELYSKASQYENEPLKFHDFNHYDKRLEISKAFIICFTNLKLSLFYLNQSNFDESKKYFIKTFAKLEINDGILEYKFKFKFNCNDSENHFQYLRDFIFNFPKFNLKNHSNINLNVEMNLKNDQNESKDSKTDDDNCSEKSTSEINFELMDFKEEIKKKFDFLPKKFNDNEEKKSESDSDDDFLNEGNLNDDEQIFNDPKKLFEFAISSKKLRNILIKEMQIIIHQMDQILFTPPYGILYGRINIKKPKQKETKELFLNDINNNFYDGFGF